MKTYRYSIYAHQEIDVGAENEEDAYLKAKEEWNRTFGKKGLFGEVEYIKEVNK